MQANRTATRASYREIGGPDGLLARRESFRGNSMSAHHEGSDYVVVSYSTEIARANHEGVIVHERYYSVTTTRQQNLRRAWL